MTSPSRSIDMPAHMYGNRNNDRATSTGASRVASSDRNTTPRRPDPSTE